MLGIWVTGDPPPPPPVSLPPTQPTPEGASCLEGGREESEGQFTANSSFDVTFFARATVHTLLAQK